MLKQLDSEYGVGRRKGGWWKWKVEPFSVDAVMIYAQAGTGGARRCTPTTPSRCGTTAARAVRQGVLGA